MQFTNELTVCVLLFSLLCAAAKAASSVSREDLVAEAIEEVKRARISNVIDVNAKYSVPKTSSDLLNAFKRASKESLQEGIKRLLFEEMVKKAERKILEKERTAQATKSDLTLNAAAVQAEALARELFHKPGSILNKDEMARILQESGCVEVTMQAPNCTTPEIKLFRTVTGVCNNLENPFFGAAHTPFSRLLQPQYEDGLSQLRGAMQNMENSLLSEGPFNPPNPSPRLISISAIRDRPIDDGRYSHLMMQWGQFLDHDLDLAPAFLHVDCSACNTTDERCAPFRIPNDDPTFGDVSPNQQCHPFARSLPVCEAGISPRQQVNELTSFIDGSQIYGSSETVANAVRESGSGRLLAGKNIPDNGGSSLPIDTADLVECFGGEDCFLAGDVRVNEQLGLITMHTIWMREHNRIVNQLATLNPRWDSEMVFQIARQIVGAELQKITFKDYLPLLLGVGFQLIPDFSYNAGTNPGIPNAFATAAFRFGHSQINPVFERLDKNFEPLSIGPLNLVDSFFQPKEYAASGGTDPLLRGLLSRQARRTDEFVNDVLTNHLFQTNSSRGMDLASLNIQRGRDHGLPPYLTWKRWAERQCGPSTDFDSELTMIRLLQTYGTLETVDLWVGGLAEEPQSGGALGATFACIFAKTFAAVRNGDRFYYENSDLNNATFTSAQRAAINNASLSRVICDNADNIPEIQPNAFRGDQARVPCASLPMVDLTAWMDPCYVRVSINPQMMDVVLQSVSVPQTSRRNSSESTPSTVMSHMATIPQGETSVCLPFVCPRNRTRIILSVSVLSGAMGQCTVQRRGRLPENQANSHRLYTGNILTQNLRRNRGLYRDVEVCSRPSSSTGLQFMCGASGARPDQQLLKDRLVVQELANELRPQGHTPPAAAAVQTLTNRMFGREISINDPIIPKEVQTLLQDETFIQELYLDEDDEGDEESDGEVDSKLMESVVGLLQSAIKQLEDTEKVEREEKEMPTLGDMIDEEPPEKDRNQANHPPETKSDDSLSKLVMQLQNAVDELGS